MTKETNQFQTEVSELLQLMIHSLYSNREIFLRELISNASDAIDKYKFQALTDETFSTKEENFEIRLNTSSKEKSITITDNGIGMSREEVIKNIGTIAHSGTKEFLAKAQEIKQNPELIGQFGVGFYSAFMVADRVRLHTQKAGESTGTIWESDGKSDYTIEDKSREQGHGTSITIFLKDFEKEEEVPDFTEEWTIRQTVKKYSDFIAYPIRMKVMREEPELDKDGKPIEGKTKSVVVDEVLNSQKALWLRPTSEIKAEEYKDFYQHLTHDWQEPQETIHFKAEGTMEYTALAYIPGAQPFNYNYRDTKYGLNLYVKRVFIMNDCEELLPSYLRFVRGLVDSNDLSLNVSREILQKDRQVSAIRKSLSNKVLRTLSDMLKNRREDYEKFWTNFGSTLKEGVPSEPSNQDKLLDLLLSQSANKEGWLSLAEYVENMPAAQKAIYYITGEDLEQLRNSPYLERLKAKGYNVLLLTDPVDEWVVGSVGKYKEKEFQSITAKDLDLDTEEEKKANESEKQAAEGELKPLMDTFQEHLKEDLESVKISDRLTETPVCLVSTGASAQMERIMDAMGQAAPKAKRIMEINHKHPLFKKMALAPKDTQKQWAEILYNQALLNEGSKIKDPLALTKKIADLMMSASERYQ